MYNLTSLTNNTFSNQLESLQYMNIKVFENNLFFFLMYCFSVRDKKNTQENSRKQMYCCISDKKASGNKERVCMCACVCVFEKIHTRTISIENRGFTHVKVFSGRPHACTQQPLVSSALMDEWRWI